MAVPRNRCSNRSKYTRRAHINKKPKGFQACSNCSNLCQPHRVCASCGTYKSQQVVAKETS